MMRSPRSFAVAVRRPSGEIVVREDRWRSLWGKAPWLKFMKRPFLRGGVVLVESLVNGIQALNFAASQQGDEDSPPLSSAAMAMTIVFAFALGLGLFVGLPHLLSWGFGELTGTDAEGRSLSFHLVDGAFKMAIFIGYVWLIGKMKEIGRVFQYHGAEHKSIYTYEKGLTLNVENARAQSRLHPRCGTSFILFVLLISIFLFSGVFPLLPKLVDNVFLNHLLYIFIKIPLMLPVAGMSYEVIRLAGRKNKSRVVRAVSWPGLQLQRLTTREPDDRQLEIALVALRKALWRESQPEMVAAGKAVPEVYKTYDDVPLPVF